MSAFGGKADIFVFLSAIALCQCRSAWRRVAEKLLRIGSAVGGKPGVTLAQALLDVAGGGAAIDADEFRCGRMVFGAAAHDDFPRIPSKARYSAFHDHRNGRRCAWLRTVGYFKGKACFATPDGTPELRNSEKLT